MKPKTTPKSQTLPHRLQGTDGVRREIKSNKNSDCKGLNPLKIFLEKGWITEDFMELYVYCFVKIRLKKKAISHTKRTFVIGWDPRDPSGNYTDAVVRGVCKAGGEALVLGVVPTPLVPLFMLNEKADGGIMVTASHNPKDQNGIKLFLPFHGMKPLPADDVDLTKILLKQSFGAIKKRSKKGKTIDCRQNALALFRDFSLMPENSWLKSTDALKDLILVVDPAFGAFKEIAAQIFREAGVGKVIEVNAGKNGAVNLRSGVADLEGCPHITADMILKPAGPFHSHKAIDRLFELGRANQKSAKAGKNRIAGAIFDADGDRFFCLKYDPFHDKLWVLSGDETAILQARHLVSSSPEKYRGSLYINTVESDLNASASAQSIGLTPLLTAVGDKWILLKIRLALIEQKRLLVNLSPKNQKELKNKFISLQKDGVTRVDILQSLEKSIPKNQAVNKSNPEVLAVGSEETGHNITTGFLTLPNQEEILIYSGNGLKSALNTFAATEHLATTLSPKRYIKVVRQPFSPGFKSTLYAYYIRQQLFHKDSLVWRKVRQLIFKTVKQNGYSAKTRNFLDDPDMLYISLAKGEAGIFVRNSGTENKISVNLRGRKSDAKKLKNIGCEILKLLFSQLKDQNNLFYKKELYILSQIACRPIMDEDLEIENQYKPRLISEMKKQGLIKLSFKGNCLTPLGKWYINH
jgi:phosphoglucosamine mutase